MQLKGNKYTVHDHEYLTVLNVLGYKLHLTCLTKGDRAYLFSQKYAWTLYMLYMYCYIYIYMS